MSERESLITECQAHVGPGWHDILKRLINDLLELGWDGHVLQVKEKFGALTFYIGAVDMGANSKAIFARIESAENESLRTCEKCGEPGELREDRSWLKTLCDKHKKEKVHE